MLEHRPQLDEIFESNNKAYRVTAISGTRVVGTLASITTPPKSADDIVCVSIKNLTVTLRRADILAAESFCTAHLGLTA